MVLGANYRSQFLFPAHAGVILQKKIDQAKALTFPRPRGGDPFLVAVYVYDDNFSPPTRG